MDDAIHIVRWVSSALLLMAFAWLSLLNWRVAWQSLVKREASPSWIPLLGGSLGALGLIAAPVPGTGAFWWLPLLLDWGCAPGLLQTLVWYFLRPGRSP